ncbi:Molybdopterin converting factor, small subunit [Actinokineospora terrae]|uniref:Molybdopterin converting factor, small subunit n=1 Tax=Actinokineospora terrae TaxID=155974 RepID=A0A1H9UFJ8_9PSEU|nr:Molybdopterin converting factor, small subunit [Actinokineospora terrae]
MRYFAGARAAAGVHEEKVQLPDDSTVQDALSALALRHGSALARVLLAASFLVDGVAVRDRSAALPDGIGLDVLPPFAGG